MSEVVYSVEGGNDGRMSWGVPYRQEISSEPLSFRIKLKPDPKLPKRHGKRIKEVGGKYHDARGRAWFRDVYIKNTLEGRALVAELLQEYGFENGTEVQMASTRWFLRCDITAKASIKDVMRQWKEWFETKVVTDPAKARSESLVLRESREEFERREKEDEEQRTRNRAKDVALTFAITRRRAAEFDASALWNEGDLGMMQSRLWRAAGLRPDSSCEKCKGLGADPDEDLMTRKGCSCLEGKEK